MGVELLSMNQNNKKIAIFYNSFTFLFLLMGIIYLYLADISMGFARDLIYREHFIKDTVLEHINEYFLSFTWLIPFSYIIYNSLKSKYYSFSIIVNISTFFFLIVFSFFFLNEYISLWAILSIFGILRLPFLFSKIQIL